MKIEIVCPVCEKGYLIEADSAGGEFVCPACVRPVPVHIPLRFEGSSAAKAADEPSDDPAPQRTTTVTTGPEQVVCPRCKLHFSPHKSHVAIDDGTRPVVLLVAQKGYFLKIAQNALSSDYRVVTASAIGEAEARLQSGGISLMVLELDDDPGGKKLLRRGLLKRCPVLIYTSRDESDTYGEEWEELRSLGADDIVIKGMHVAETLARRVGALLGRPWDDEETG